MSDDDSTLSKTVFEWYDDKFWAIVLGFIFGRVWSELGDAFQATIIDISLSVAVFVALLLVAFGVVLWWRLSNNPTL